jgi:hypothetical protein
MQLFDERAADMPNVPLLQELTTNERDTAAAKFLALQRAPGKSFVAPPNVPADRLAALRAAFVAMTKDPEFKADLAKAQQELDPRTWQDVARIFRETIDTQTDIVAYAKELMAAGKK